MLNKLLYPIKRIGYSLRSMNVVQKEALRLHLGHTKVIGWEGGFPVHSLFIPCEHTRPMNLARARFYNSLRFGYQIPVNCNLAVTHACDCRCLHCSEYGQAEGELSTDQWKRVIGDVQELGVFSIIFTGGEPLQRPDLCELIATVNPNQAVPLVITNGTQLESQVDALKQAGLNRIFVSLDYAEAERHDHHRGQQGVYTRAVAGIQAALSRHMLVGISTFASPERLDEGALDGIFDLGERLGVHEVAVFDAIPMGRYAGHKTIPVLGDRYYDQLKDYLDRQQSQRRRMGIWAYRQVRSSQSCGCSAGQNTFKITANGDMQPCAFGRATVGNVTDVSLADLWNRLQIMGQNHRKEGAGCWLLQDRSSRSDTHR